MNFHRCGLCEFPARDGQEVLLVLTGILVLGCIKYQTVELFHRDCWETKQDRPLEGVTDAPHSTDDSPPHPSQ